MHEIGGPSAIGELKILDMFGKTVSAQVNSALAWCLQKDTLENERGGGSE